MIVPEFFPAIDLRDGRCVRLVQGDYDRETVYGDDPVAQALAFQDAGADWVHVVDLDAARSGSPVNRSAVAAVTAALWATDPGLFWRPDDQVSLVQSVYPSKAKKPSNTAALPVFEGVTGLDEAVLEGWLYAPVFIGQERGLQS